MIFMSNSQVFEQYTSLSTFGTWRAVATCFRMMGAPRSRCVSSCSHHRMIHINTPLNGYIHCIIYIYIYIYIYVHMYIYISYTVQKYIVWCIYICAWSKCFRMMGAPRSRCVSSYLVFVVWCFVFVVSCVVFSVWCLVCGL